MSFPDPLLERLSSPPASRRPIPFWSWNDKLAPAFLADQAAQMAERGEGGFFMHARGGLETEYLSDEWMTCIKVGIAAARKNGTEAWAYDEEGWPSGFAGGRVPALGEKYHGRWLSLESSGGELLRRFGDRAVYVHRNPNYIDVLSADAVKAFIAETHERYRTSLGSDFSFLKGFFTDEPRLSGSIDRDMPWSPLLPEFFREEYGYELEENLLALFFPEPGHEALRYDFWRLVSRLFVSSFMAQIHEWCVRSGCELTGHVMMEESVYVQMANTGGVMPFYEHMDMPGIDWLRRGIGSPIVPKQLGSVAAQLGKSRAITESFALCGWDASPEELRWIAHWQFVNGVNMLCQHLSAYSIRGFRKRDYPPSLFYQQPWWDKYGSFNDYIARLGLFLSEGKSAAHVLLIHPIRSGWVLYDGQSYGLDMRELDANFVRAAEWLSGGHIEYHMGDETIIEAHGSADGRELVVGECRYNAVVLPAMRCVASSTLELLLEFSAAGGDIVSIGELPSLVDGRPSARLSELRKAARSVDFLSASARAALPAMAALSPSVRRTGDGSKAEEIGAVHIAVRDCGKRKLVFLANLDRESGYGAVVELPWGGRVSRCDLEYCSLETLNAAPASAEGVAPGSAWRTIEIELPPMGAQCLVVDTDTAQTLPADPAAIARPSKPVEPLIIRPEADWEWEIDECDLNAVTLDECEYRMDGGQWLPPKSVIAIQAELLALRRACEVSLRFVFDSELPDRQEPLFLVIERPEDFLIELNGKAVPVVDRGPWKDRSFRKIDITSFAQRGRNVLVLSRKFYQSPRVYEVLYGEGVYETEKNKLTYDVELESVYLLGDFSVRSRSPFTSGERNSIHTEGPFVLGESVARITSGDLTSRGFAFFSGKISLSRDLGPLKRDGRRIIIDLGHPRAAMVELSLNGKRAALLSWAPFRVDLTDALGEGENRLEILLYSSNRNLLGPHHHSDGESYKVGPDSFTGKWSWAEKATEAFPATDEERTKDYWQGGYSFVTFGLI
jgi:hypothetical protein